MSSLKESKNNEVSQFKTPAHLVRKKPKILTEEKYIEELSKIIQRDFFPDLEKLKAQNAYLDALERKDYVQMERIREKYSGRCHTNKRSRSMTPATFETPRSLSEDATPKSTISAASSTSTKTTNSIGEKHSLDSFLQAYTSEDNYSFEEIIDNAAQKLRQKFAVLFKEETVSKENMAKALALPGIEEQFQKEDTMKKIDTWTYKNINSVMYIPDGVPLTESEKIEAVNRKQVIQHSATRLDINPFENTLKKSGDSQSTNNSSQVDRIGAHGLPSTSMVAPQIRGFDLIKTPSPKPGEAFSPLMTWGEIEGTPFRLDGGDTPVVRHNTGTGFKINENSRREAIGLALAEKVGEKMRAQKAKAMDTARKNINSPFIRSNMDRLASMSPAARRLATTKLGLRTPMLTPSISTPIQSKKTPKMSTTSSSRSRTNETGSSDNNLNKSTLTDDLLKIPTKRLKASDFF